MIVGSLAFLVAAVGPVLAVLVLVAPRPTDPQLCRCWRYNSPSRFCPLHQARTERLADAAMKYPGYALLTVLGFIAGVTMGVSSLWCGPFADSWGCYGGLPWP